MHSRPYPNLTLFYRRVYNNENIFVLSTGDGILVRDGASVRICMCTLSRNGGYGLHLVDSSAHVESTSSLDNRSGSVATELGANLELTGDGNVVYSVYTL
jgi:hypothetical protein